jgi:hypothetical protein
MLDWFAFTVNPTAEADRTTQSGVSARTRPAQRAIVQLDGADGARRCAYFVAVFGVSHDACSHLPWNLPFTVIV